MDWNKRFRRCVCVLCMGLEEAMAESTCRDHERKWGLEIENCGLDAFTSESESESESESQSRSVDSDHDDYDHDHDHVYNSECDSDEHDRKCDHESEDDDDSEHEHGLNDTAISEFAREIMELVTLGLMKESALEKVLISFHSLLAKTGYAETFQDVPRSFYLLQKYANLGNDPIHSVLLDICPTRDHYVFEADSKETVCPLCKVPRTYVQTMSFLLFTLILSRSLTRS